MKISLSHVISCDKSANVQTHSQSTFMWSVYFIASNTQNSHTRAIQHTHTHPFAVIRFTMLCNARASQCFCTWSESAVWMVFYRCTVCILYSVQSSDIQRAKAHGFTLFSSFILFSLSRSVFSSLSDRPLVHPPVCLSLRLPSLFDIEPYKKRN